MQELGKYVDYCDCVLQNRPWLCYPVESRDTAFPVVSRGKTGGGSEDHVALIPHEAAAASTFIGHAMAARLTLQQVLMHDLQTHTSETTLAKIDQARGWLRTIVTHMDSWTTGDCTDWQAIAHAKKHNRPVQSNAAKFKAFATAHSIPVRAAETILSHPYNQSMCGTTLL